MKRAPKKFTDESQSEITDEWREWYAQSVAEGADEIESNLAFMGTPPEDVYPERHGKDIGEGAWILVVEEPHTEMRHRFRIPTPSLWYARPEAGRPGGWTHKVGRTPIQVPGPYRVVIETPGGSLWLFPHEYVICQDPVPLITDPECTIHPLGGKATVAEEHEEALFYLQSRGIAHGDALLLLMDGVDWSQWGWVEFPEYARAMFEGVGSMTRYREMFTRTRVMTG